MTLPGTNPKWQELPDGPGLWMVQTKMTPDPRYGWEGIYMLEFLHLTDGGWRGWVRDAEAKEGPGFMETSNEYTRYFGPIPKPGDMPDDDVTWEHRRTGLAWGYTAAALEDMGAMYD